MIYDHNQYFLKYSEHNVPYLVFGDILNGQIYTS